MSSRQSHTFADLKILIEPVVLFAEPQVDPVAGLKRYVDRLPSMLAVGARIFHVRVELRCNLCCNLPDQTAVLRTWSKTKNSKRSVVTRAIAVTDRRIVIWID